MVEGLSVEQWVTLCPDEGRTVGVLARHVAASIPFEMAYFRKFAAGHQPALITLADLHAQNAADADEWANCTKDEVLPLLHSYAAAAAAEIRQWDDEQFLQVGMCVQGGPTRTVEQWIDRTLCGHIRDHLQSTRVTLALG
ncbi:MAG: maleylpyruvate isomerase N-terminal domain-containing protein [Thermomicrobiales bacterium]